MDLTSLAPFAHSLDLRPPVVVPFPFFLLGLLHIPLLYSPAAFHFFGIFHTWFTPHFISSEAPAVISARALRAP